LDEHKILSGWSGEEKCLRAGISNLSLPVRSLDTVLTALCNIRK